MEKTHTPVDLWISPRSQDTLYNLQVEHLNKILFNKLKFLRCSQARHDVRRVRRQDGQEAIGKNYAKVVQVRW